MAMFADNDMAASRGFTSVNLMLRPRVNDAGDGFQRKPSFLPTESPTTPASSTLPSLFSSLYCAPASSTRSSYAPVRKRSSVSDPAYNAESGVAGDRYNVILRTAFSRIAKLVRSSGQAADRMTSLPRIGAALSSRRVSGVIQIVE